MVNRVFLVLCTLLLSLAGSLCMILRGGAVPRFLLFSLPPRVQSAGRPLPRPLSLPADLCLVLVKHLGQAGFIALLQLATRHQPRISAIFTESGFPIPFLATAESTLYLYRVCSMGELFQGELLLNIGRSYVVILQKK